MLLTVSPYGEMEKKKKQHHRIITNYSSLTTCWQSKTDSILCINHDKNRLKINQFNIMNCSLCSNTLYCCFEIWHFGNTLWADSADKKLVIFFIFSPESRIWHFFNGENLPELSNPVYWGNVKSCFLEKMRKLFQNDICSKFYPGY